MKGETKKWPKWPTPKGKLAIYPKIVYGRSCEIEIVGDPEGLLYLSGLLRQLAEMNQDDMPIPNGAYAHLHIRPECELAYHSTEVTLSRADAKGTGMLLELFDD